MPSVAIYEQALPRRVTNPQVLKKDSKTIVELSLLVLTNQNGKFSCPAKRIYLSILLENSHSVSRANR
jgi:hypothetical protein